MDAAVTGPATVAMTDRLHVRELVPGDAGFVVALLNQPDFLQHIGDRGVRDAAGAAAYLRDGPIASYARHGHGLYALERRSDGVLIGMCGLVVRDGLPGPDLGFALLPDYYRQGYAFEAARAVLGHARTACGVGRVLAVVSPGNARSTGLLHRLGFIDAGTVRLPGQAADVRLFASPEP